MKFARLAERADAARLRRRRHRPPRPRSAGATAAGRSSAAPTGPRTRATSCTCSARPSSARTLFPVGELTTRPRCARIAAALGLRTAAKPDSQDVCFITSTGGRDDVPRPAASRSTRRASSTPPARRSATVAAVELVTVGQRKGLGLPGGGPKRYVVDVDRATATVVVGDEADLLVDDARGRRDVAWVDEPVAGDVLVQCSAHGAPRPATLADAPAASTCAGTSPQRRVAPGQSVVFYDPTDRFVLGGGIAAYDGVGLAECPAARRTRGANTRISGRGGGGGRLASTAPGRVGETSRPSGGSPRPRGVAGRGARTTVAASPSTISTAQPGRRTGEVERRRSPGASRRDRARRSGVVASSASRRARPGRARRGRPAPSTSQRRLSWCQRRGQQPASPPRRRRVATPARTQARAAQASGAAITAATQTDHDTTRGGEVAERRTQREALLVAVRRRLHVRPSRVGRRRPGRSRRGRDARREHGSAVGARRPGRHRRRRPPPERPPARPSASPAPGRRARARRRPSRPRRRSCRRAARLAARRPRHRRSPRRRRRPRASQARRAPHSVSRPQIRAPARRTWDDVGHGVKTCRRHGPAANVRGTCASATRRGRAMD